MAKREKTNQQVEVYFFKKEGEETKYLVMKRVPEKGGFWQPLTGGNEVGETLEETVVREAGEETGITKLNRVINTGYKFEFNDHGKDYVETIYGAEVDPNTEVKISSEHSEYKWATKTEALALLKWPNNKEGLEILDTMVHPEKKGLPAPEGGKPVPLPEQPTIKK
jgi:8-oxo-dGTP pyrophosphatase MutT (NUDIX family)